MTYDEFTKSTEAQEIACEVVFEELTGGCWHGFVFKDDEWLCTKCNLNWYRAIDNDYGTEYYIIDEHGGEHLVDGPQDNPNLADLLDAWREHIWPVIDEQKEQYNRRLQCIAIDTGLYWWEFEPLHHLYAALHCEVECGECGGKCIVMCEHDQMCALPDFSCGLEGRCDGETVDCHCTNGRVKLMELVERRVVG